jgi:hypothetical protein
MSQLSIRKPSAFLPLAISGSALLLVLGHAAVYGSAHEADEGAAAHIFQLLMLAQAAIMLFFAVKWLPLARLHAVRILGIQLLAAAVALVSVFFLT